MNRACPLTMLMKCTMLDKYERRVFLRILFIRLEWTHIHTPTGTMQYPLPITLHEGIIKTSINIAWPKIFTGKNTKGICMNHGAKIYRYENKKQILNNSGLSNIWIKPPPPQKTTHYMYPPQKKNNKNSVFR